MRAPRVDSGAVSVDQDDHPRKIDHVTSMSEHIHAQASRYGNAHADLNQQTGRDVRLDLFRGLSLFFIFIDHIPNNVLSYVTLRSIGFSDAAEVFVSFPATPLPQFMERHCGGKDPSSPRPRSIDGFGNSISRTFSHS